MKKNNILLIILILLLTIGAYTYFKSLSKPQNPADIDPCKKHKCRQYIEQEAPNNGGIQGMASFDVFLYECLYYKKNKLRCNLQIL